MSTTTAKPRAYILKVSGEEVPLEPKNGTDFQLVELQAVVGGCIEIHYLPDDKVIVLNEEGMREKLPVNPAATVYAHNLFNLNGILGDVLICDSDMIR